jgi:pimeloyl-ACP methyl ester carboxylesterase
VVQALCASAATAGCGLLSRGPLRESPDWFDPTAPRPPVVFVHGAFGSRLRHRTTGAEIWPVGTAELLVSSFPELALPLDPETGDALPDDIVAYELFEGAGVVDFYGSLVTMLVKAGGYLRETPGTPVRGAGPRLYVFLYDWRRDLSQAAAQLDALIEQVRADHGQADLKVDLVGHSSGGLVNRYYLLYGGRTLDPPGLPAPDFSGARKVNRVVAIGVPELGITRAAASLIDGEPLVLSRVYPEVLATSHTTFQLLPSGDDTWLLDASGRPMVADSCNVDVWRELRMSVFDPALRARVGGAAGGRKAGRARVALLERSFERRLARARRFREALRPVPLPAEVPYFSIGGDCMPTQARLLVERLGGEPHVRTQPDQVRWPSPALDYQALMLENGDGTVTRSSVAGRPRWPSAGQRAPLPALNRPWQEFVCASHNQLVVNVDCQRALLRALGEVRTASTGCAPPSARLCG